MKYILEFLAALTFNQVLIVIGLCFLGYILYIKVTDNAYYSKLHDIKQKHQSLLWEYISETLSLVESNSLDKVETLMANLDAPDNDKEYQSDMFALVLERVLYYDVFEKIKTAVRQNGFYTLTKLELNEYIDTKSNVILTYTRKRLRLRSSKFPLLKPSQDERFNYNHTRQFFVMIIDKAIDVKLDEDADLKSLKEEYSILNKLNIFKKLIKKINKTIK